MKHESYVSLDAIKMIKEAELYKNHDIMEIYLIKNVVTTTKRTDRFKLDFDELFRLVMRNFEMPLDELTDDVRDDIILEFESNIFDYLNELFGIEIYDLPDDDCDGYDIDDNAATIEDIKDKFAEYVYNF